MHFRKGHSISKNVSRKTIPEAFFAYGKTISKLFFAYGKTILKTFFAYGKVLPEGFLLMERSFQNSCYEKLVLEQLFSDSLLGRPGIGIKLYEYLQVKFSHGSHKWCPVPAGYLPLKVRELIIPQLDPSFSEE